MVVQRAADAPQWHRRALFVQVLSILLLHVQRVAVAEGVNLGAAHNTRSSINNLFLIV